MKKPSIAIIGGGISGLSAAYLLQKNHDVTIYEASDKFGGHARTIHSLINDKRVPVDVGFIVYNKKTYPNFCKLIDDLGVESQSSDMSFAIYNKKRNSIILLVDLMGFLLKRETFYLARFGVCLLIL